MSRVDYSAAVLCGIVARCMEFIPRYYYSLVALSRRRFFVLRPFVHSGTTTFTSTRWKALFWYSNRTGELLWDCVMSVCYSSLVVLTSSSFHSSPSFHLSPLYIEYSGITYQCLSSIVMVPCIWIPLGT